MAAKNAAVFELCWRTMRDNWYDEKLNNRDWKAIQAKSQTISAQAVDAESLATVVNLMLGELNGSHLGFFISPGGASPRRGAPATDPLASGKWSRATLHPEQPRRFLEGDIGEGGVVFVHPGLGHPDHPEPL